VACGIQKLEAQFGIPLFDRLACRLALTEAGVHCCHGSAGSPRRQNAFRNTARSLAGGLEAELTIMRDAFTAKFLIVRTPPAPTTKPVDGFGELADDLCHQLECRAWHLRGANRKNAK
jgi:hypothetical protein